MKLGDIVRNIRLADFGREAPGWLPRLVEPLNRSLDGILRALSNLTLSDNMQCDVVTAAFTHGVPQAVKLTKLPFANSAIVLGCESQLAGPPLVRMGPSGQCIVTIFFNDTSARNVQVGLLCLMEGVPQTKIPTFFPGLPPVGSAGQVLTVVSGAAAWAAASSGSGGAWTLATKPSSPDSRDDEFEGTAYTGWTDLGTKVATAIDPYVNFATAGNWRHSWNGLRPSWLMMQPAQDSGLEGIYKAITMGTNDMVWTRVSQNSGATGMNTLTSTIQLMVSDTSPGSWPTTNNCNIYITWNAYTAHIQTQAGDTAVVASATPFNSAPIEYLLMHKVGTLWHFWCAPSTGSWIYLGNKTNSFTPGYVMIRAIGASGLTPSIPGPVSMNAIMGVDFIRFKATATDLP